MSLLAAFFGLMAQALFASAELFYFAPRLIMRVGPMSAFSMDQFNALILLSLRFYEFAGAILTVYYGMAWIIRGYLMFRSGYLRKFPWCVDGY